MLGTWHLPPSVDDRPLGEVSGDVVFDESGGWTLTVHGSLQRLPHPDSLPHKQPVIWGETVDNQRVSLFDGFCVARRRFMLTDNKPTEEWLGLHYSVGRSHVTLDTLVRSLNIKFDRLDTWGCWDASSLHYNFASGTITIPDSTSYPVLYTGANMSLVCGWIVTDSVDSASVAREAFFTVEDIVSIRDLQAKWITPLQGLLSFLILNYAAVTETTARLSDPDESISLHFSAPRPGTRDTSTQQPIYMLLTHGQLADYDLSLDTIVQNWFQLNASHRIALDFIQFLYTNPTLYPPAAFLIAFMAIEAYHQAEFDDMASPPDEYKNKVQSVLETVPKEDKQWVKDRLLSGNRKGQLRKYGEVSCIAEPTRALIESVWPNFGKAVIKQRQKAAHPAETDPKDAISCQAARIGLLWILRHVYLVKVGLSSDGAARVIGRNQVFLRELELLQDSYEQVTAG